MRRLPIAVVVLFLAGFAHAQKLGPVDWIFLVDTSKSMRGVGGTKDIFNDVKASMDSFVAEANDGDSVAIYTFARDVELRSSTGIDAKARNDLHEIIRSLKAEGDRTHLGAAIAEGLERARNDPTRTRAVVLFTDGKEDVRGIKNATKIATNLDRVGDAYIFFVSMGEHEPQLDAFAKATPRTTVLRATEVEEIRRIAQAIRARIPAPPPPPNVRPRRPRAAAAPPPPPSLLARALRIAIPLIVLAAIALLALQQKKKQNRLEGELEMLRPSAAFIGLPQLQKNEVALSSILPLDALAGSDARLFVKRKAGKKKIWIAASGGSLRINDVETPLSELYDADTIEIGGAKLRFNRVGDERPLNPSEEGLL